MEVPKGIDALVQEKEKMTQEEWSDRVRSFYEALSTSAPAKEHTYEALSTSAPAKEHTYEETTLDTKDVENNRMDYINMAHDVLSDMYRKQGKKKSGT